MNMYDVTFYNRNDKFREEKFKHVIVPANDKSEAYERVKTEYIDSVIVKIKKTNKKSENFNPDEKRIIGKYC